jgi:GNAT superfamily N-acetyltransferase
MPSPPPVLALTPEPSPDEATVKAIAAGLDDHNALFALAADWRPRWIVGRDAAGTVQAGTQYVVAFEWLFVRRLCVVEPYRKRGVGSRLLMGTAADARENHCLGAYLDTFTFQAPKFYERHGYREFGRLDEFPPPPGATRASGLRGRCRRGPRVQARG